MNKTQLIKTGVPGKTSVAKALMFSALVLGSTAAQAQKGFYAGVNLGMQAFTLINKSDVAAGPELDFKLKSNMIMGVGGGYNLNKRLGVSLDVIFSKQTQGYKGQFNSNPDSNVYVAQIKNLAIMNNLATTGAYTSDVTLSCLKIPVLLNFYTNNSKRIYFTAFAGPQLTMINAVNLKVNDKETPLTGTNIISKDVYKSSSVDAVFGLGLGVKITQAIHVAARLRLEYSLGDVENKDLKFTYSNAQYRYFSTNRDATHTAAAGLMLSAYYKFGKKILPVPGKKK